MKWHQNNRRIMVVVLVAAVIVLLGATGRLEPVRAVFGWAFSPIGRFVVGGGSSIGESLGAITQVRNLASENARLNRENAALRQRLAADAETRRDNELLRNQLGLDVAGSNRQVAAEIVSAQPDSYHQFVTINKGTKAGIGVGMAVMSDGVLIGTIAQATGSSARIILVTDPEFKLAAKDQESGATGIISGRLGSGLQLDKIGQTDSVKPGDTVTSSGLGGLVPAGLYIGQIESVDTRANAVFQSAQVATTMRVSQLRFAYVVVGP